jgi:hypothetical protein
MSLRDQIVSIIKVGGEQSPYIWPAHATQATEG